MRILWLASSAWVIGLDQFTKYLSIRYLTFDQEVSVLPGFALTLRHNTGAAFSFLASASGWQRWFFILLALVMSTIMFIWLGRLSEHAKQESFALSLILGGALGNLIDRLIHGYVVDFILLYYQKWQWPAFNVADTAICIGTILLIPILCKKNS